MEVQCLLQLGEKFSLPNFNISHQIIFDFIKYIECNVKRLDPEVSHHIRNHAVHCLKEYLAIPSTIASDFDRNILKLTKTIKVFLADHPELIVTKADKGNATVILDRDTYLIKMSDLLSDTETYTIVKSDPTKKNF